MRFLHVSIIWGGNGKPADQLSAILNLAEDWYSYGNGFYVLYTSEDLFTWQSRFVAIIDQSSDSFFISEIPDVHRDTSGWMKKPFWDWLRANKQPQTLVNQLSELARLLPPSNK